MFTTYDNNGNVTTELKNHLLESSTISTESLVIAEWNLNNFDNIYKIGNYRYRPNDNNDTYYQLPTNAYSNFANQSSNSATNSDIVIDGGYDKNEDPIFILQEDKKTKFYYSLEDCFNRFRPRSGINKATNADYRLAHVFDANLAKRPRYYVADKNDIFKYWTSYRTEVVNFETKQRGISKDDNYIEDAVPFVIYKNMINANRIIIKMQTHVGDTSSRPISSDPWVGTASVPQNWKVDLLDSNGDWQLAITLNSYSIPNDGYVELAFGPPIPTQYQEIFIYEGEYSNVNSLPTQNNNGAAYLIGNQYYMWLDSTSSYVSFSAVPTWQPISNFIDRVKPYVTDFNKTNSTIKQYASFKGIRIAVSTMKKRDIPFELIELSPRLCADVSDRTIEFEVDKKASDLSDNGLPIGDMLASTGTISIFDYDQSFDKNNSNSIIQGISFKNLQFKFYQKILNVSGYDYSIPIKTMYVDGFPETSYMDRTISITLRDLFVYFESVTAPKLFLRNKTFKYIVSMLLDAAGFSNYYFKNLTTDTEIIIPDFFVGPDKSLAEVLQDLAKSTQSTMFFDEDNNFIIMSRDYMIPSSEQVRATDITLYGSSDQIKGKDWDNGAYSNLTNLTGTQKISNIIEMNVESHEIYNDGKILYTDRSIQKNVSDLNMYDKLNYEKTYTYQPVLLWDFAESNSSKNTEQKSSKNTGYTLSAVTLNSDISDANPFVVGQEIKNQIIDVGESVYWLNNYSGYLFANGEIIKYDAKQYTVSGVEGNVWISSEKDMQYYMSKIPYGGMVKPTGKIRIYAQPYLDNAGLLKQGAVEKDGRGQFGTDIVAHNAGLNSDWKNVRAGAVMDFDYLSGAKKTAPSLLNPGIVSVAFTPKAAEDFVATAGKGLKTLQTTSTSGGSISLEDDKNNSTINGIIRNQLSSSYISDIEYKNSTNGLTGAIQSSALVFTGNKNYSRAEPKNYIQYTYKDALTFKGDDGTSTWFYKPQSIGARIRIIGQPAYDKRNIQNMVGEMIYYPQETIKIDDKDQTLDISGGSGGIILHLNEETNAGYYFEVAALSSYSAENDANVWFYKLQRQGVPVYYNDPTITGNVTLNIAIDENNPNILISSSNQSINNLFRSRTTGLAATLSKDDRVFLRNQQKSQTHNGYFKVVEVGSATTKWKLERDELAIPKVLFQAKYNILSDYTGSLGNTRLQPTDKTPTYDLKVESYKNDKNQLQFLLYIDGKYIGTGIDDNPLLETSKIGMFIRGTSKLMFEHIYALSDRTGKDIISQIHNDINETKLINNRSSSVFDLSNINQSSTFRKFGLNEVILQDYFAGQDSVSFKTRIFYDEFGTILRECAYMNIRYDKAYPALASKIANNYNPYLGYYVSNFRPNAYGAEFMVFNTTDIPLAMDSSTGNYLRINGITFTAESNNELSVDEYFDLINNYSFYSDSGLPKNTSEAKNDLSLIKNSRITYGKKDFTIDGLYIQSRDMAYDIMKWMINKIKKPKLALGIEVFGLPILQLGDIVNIDYQSNTNIDIPSTSRFVVYCIKHSAGENGITQTIYLSEVL